MRYEGCCERCGLCGRHVDENVNRTALNSFYFRQSGGNVGKLSVSFGFDEVSLVIVPAVGLDEEKAMEIALEAGEVFKVRRGLRNQPQVTCCTIRDAFVDAEVEPIRPADNDSAK